MEIKGNLGEEVWIKATIKKIMISEDKTEYSVKLDVNDMTFFIDEDDIRFEKDEKNTTVEKDPEEPEENPNKVSCRTCAYRSQRGSEHPCDECNNNFSQYVMSQEGKKRRGRPRKATVNDLMDRVEKIKRKKENEEKEEGAAHD